MRQHQGPGLHWGCCDDGGSCSLSPDPATGVKKTPGQPVRCTVLHCTVLYCTVLYCSVLYYVLHCTPAASLQTQPQVWRGHLDSRGKEGFMTSLVWHRWMSLNIRNIWTGRLLLLVEIWMPFHNYLYWQFVLSFLQIIWILNVHQCQYWKTLMIHNKARF